MEPATRFIDEASDFADEGKIDEAVASFHKALDELARIELENPERAAKPEFASVRNKRAYIEASIDSLLLSQAQRNAKAVSVTDTSELERKFAEEQAARREARANRGKTASDRGRAPTPATDPVADGGDRLDEALQAVAEAEAQAAANRPKDRRALLIQARDDLSAKRYETALEALGLVLKKNPKDAAALNMRAMVEKAMGNNKAAEATFTELIQANPRAHYGFYNFAKFILETQGEAGKDAARRYYRTGREFGGGPVDAFLEEALK